MSTQERRRFRRVPISTRIEAEAGGEVYSVTAENISRGGLLVRSPKTLPEGSRVRLTFTLPAPAPTKSVEAGPVPPPAGGSAAGREFRIVGTVQHTSPNAFMGVRFDNLSPEDLQAISLFVESKDVPAEASGTQTPRKA